MDNKLDQDLKTIVECEGDSNINECQDEEFTHVENFEDNFKHLELRRDHDPYSTIYIHNSDGDDKQDTNVSKFHRIEERKSKIEESKVPSNLFGSRTYTSPASLDSSSGNSTGEHKYQISKKQKSLISKLKSEQNSEKFSMLRNIVENIDDPEKRKILLNFLDQSTLKTEYVTVKESSSSGEHAKVVHKISNNMKKRRKSPSGLGDQHRLQCDPKFIASSQERKRYSLANQRVHDVSHHEQQLHHIAIDRKHASDGCNSKNGDQCYTEESREVPLESILNRINYQQHPVRMKSRRQSGYSASHEKTQPGEHDLAFDNFNFDIEAGLDLEGKPNAVENTDEMVKLKLLNTWTGWIKSLLIFILIICLVGITTRGIYLEIRHKSDARDIHSMSNELTDVYAANDIWEKKYNECAYGTGIDRDYSLDNNGGGVDTTSFHSESP